ncbi:Metallo-hydrolase/oxidoreductase [Athelia psychrophila]|uniref:Metallo-hydrolase/oxidoreductase n=1 Tax=Athelia psychrophila TaxID=1759441 RepID=A0A166IZP5_9AGAM|nr:Metallo-hydrolase/oxidoreductase [Fibularhizoctonia sp. CBS 109695]
MAENNWSLPADTASQTYLSISAIPVGSLYLSDNQVFEDCAQQGPGVANGSERLAGTGRRVPSFSFLVQHEQHGRLLFDLGLRKHGKGYPPGIQKRIAPLWIKCRQDLVEILEAGGVKSEDIGTVIYSHLHFDHVGDLTHFPSALLVVGGGAAEELASPYPLNPESDVLALPEGQKVHYEDFSNNIPLGPFPKAVDYFKDGSLYLVDAPGHYPGHLNALARIGPNQFVLLAADCCHHRLCFAPGERLVSRESHVDIEVAQTTLESVKAMHKAKNVVVLLAHDDTLLHELGDERLFPSPLNAWASREIEKKHQA